MARLITRRDVLPLILSILIAQSAGILRAIFSFVYVESWYYALEKPNWTPEDWVYIPIWFVLYTLMGISSYLVWKSYARSKSSEIKNALYLYLIHLVVNVAWLVVCLGVQQIAGGLIVILVMLSMIIVIISKFWKIQRLAALLLLPYLLWVIYVTALNAAVFLLNR